MAGDGTSSASAQESAAPYTAKPQSPPDPEAAAPSPEMTGDQRLVLRLFGNLSPEKQLAWLTLMKR